MGEIKKLARAEIEFDAQGLDNGQIEFAIEGGQWVAFPADVIRPSVRRLAAEITALRGQYDISFEGAVTVLGLAKVV